MTSDLVVLAAFLSPVFPSALWFAAPILLVLLGYAALRDAFTGRVPDLPVLFALGLTLLFSAYAERWALTLERILLAVGAFGLLRLTNALYYFITRRDAFGMGDVKWTAAAAAAFGLPAVFWAWVFGAWIGLIWMGVRFVVTLVCRGVCARGYIHFAPFLMIGLLSKLYGWSLLARLGAWF